MRSWKVWLVVISLMSSAPNAILTCELQAWGLSLREEYDSHLLELLFVSDRDRGQVIG